MGTTRVDPDRIFALASQYRWTAKSSTEGARNDHLDRLRCELLARSDATEAAVIADLPPPPTPDQHREVPRSRGAVDLTRPA